MGEDWKGRREEDSGRARDKGEREGEGGEGEALADLVMALVSILGQ